MRKAGASPKALHESNEDLIVESASDEETKLKGQSKTTAFLSDLALRADTY